jgi:hypothetical protein
MTCAVTRRHTCRVPSPDPTPSGTPTRTDEARTASQEPAPGHQHQPQARPRHPTHHDVLRGLPGPVAGGRDVARSGARTCRAAGCTDVSKTLPASPPGRIPFVTPSLLHGTVTGDADLSTAAAVGCAGPPRRGLFGWVTIDEAAGIGRRRRAARVCMDGWNPRSRGRDRGATRVGGPKVLAEFPPTTWLTGSRLHQHARSPAPVHPPAPHPTSPPLFCFVRCVGEVVCPVALRFLAEDHAVEIRSLQGIDSCLRFSNLAICWNYLSSPGCTFF